MARTENFSTCFVSQKKVQYMSHMLSKQQKVEKTIDNYNL